MIQKPSGRSHIEREELKLNLTPYIDFLVTLIVFLIATIVVAPAAILDINLPSASAPVVTPEQQQEQKPSITLTVAIQHTGFTIGGSGAVLPEIPLKNGGYDYEALSQKLLEIKKVYPDTTDVILLSEPDIKYDILIHVMDTVREATVTENGQKKAVALFPDISIGEVVK
ncbi:MAG: biopolymer transporter ExbD [Deltaproteobacteria bacterium]|nr:biopolymer transporter ExbD [Deltaproteobacteria bacterium]MCL5277031.1 biopolymer transporter ExbD [Deltaproteobacteria bacterium]